jgi:hypothetical protein
MMDLKTLVVVYFAGLYFAFIILAPAIELIGAFDSGEPFELFLLHVVDSLNVALFFFVQSDVFQEIGDLLRSRVDFWVHFVKRSFLIF